VYCGKNAKPRRARVASAANGGRVDNYDERPEWRLGYPPSPVASARRADFALSLLEVQMH